ncbi:MAG: hypothetical protein DRN96_04700 [Thermoproteota archaeon]|nr:MAG: hypothetical protein DRN96_04700 [Candidatus Korarchaeota archaeon]
MRVDAKLVGGILIISFQDRPSVKYLLTVKMKAGKPSRVVVERSREDPATGEWSSYSVVAEAPVRG